MRQKSGGGQFGSWNSTSTNYQRPPSPRSTTQNIKNGQTTMNVDYSTGLWHKPNCTSSLSTMVYDPTCVRCSKIKIVVYLRRKTVENGTSEEEQDAAIKMATSIREKFKLTRGEIFDRQYETVPTQQQAKETFKRSARKMRQRHAWVDDEEVVQ